MMPMLSFAGCACDWLDILLGVVEAYRIAVAAVAIAFFGSLLGISVFAVAWILGR